MPEPSQADAVVPGNLRRDDPVPAEARSDQVVNIPNALSLLRLLLVPVFSGSSSPVTTGGPSSCSR